MYYPIYRAGFGKINNKFQPMSSGHFYKGKQTFIGYHYLVYNNSKVVHTLKDKYTGFHAGDYKVNCESVGIAIVDDLAEKMPSLGALEGVKTVLANYSSINLIAHSKVIHNGKPVKGLCPGKYWEEWKKDLVA